MNSAGNSGGSSPPWGSSGVWELIPAGRGNSSPSGAHPSPEGDFTDPATLLCSGKGNFAAFLVEACSKHPKLAVPNFRDDSNISMPWKFLLPAPDFAELSLTAGRRKWGSSPSWITGGNRICIPWALEPFFGIFQAEGQWWEGAKPQRVWSLCWENPKIHLFPF